MSESVVLSDILHVADVLHRQSQNRMQQKLRPPRCVLATTKWIGVKVECQRYVTELSIVY